MTRREASDPRAGVSLIELMIVVAVLAVLAVAVSLSVVPNGSDGRGDASRFVRLAKTLSDRAVLTRGRLALSVDAEGWQILNPARDGPGWRATGRGGAWRRPARFSAPDDTALQGLPGAADDAGSGPDPAADAALVFLADGRITPVKAQFGTASGLFRLCETSGWDGVACRPQ